MSVIFLLILISLAVAIVFLTAFLWAVKNGQYDDDYSPSVRILFDDGVVPKSDKTKSNKNSPCPTRKKLILENN